MKITTTKASPALLGFLGKGAKPQEIPWPSENSCDSSANLETPVVSPRETTIQVTPAPVDSVATCTPQAPAPVGEVGPEILPVVESRKEKEECIAENVISLAPPTLEPTLLEPVNQELAAVELPLPVAPPIVEESPVAETQRVELPPQTPVAEPVVEMAPVLARKPPTMRELLESDGWIRNLCTELIESEKRLLEEGAQRGLRATSPTQDPIKAMWSRFRQNGNREKFLAEVEKESRRISGRNLEIEIPRDRLVELKQTFLKAIRHIQEPYRSTLFRHFCEGLSIAEIIGRQEISGWIVRQRLVAGLDLLDRTLEEMLGKERIRNYVLLSKVGAN